MTIHSPSPLSESLTPSSLRFVYSSPTYHACVWVAPKALEQWHLMSIHQHIPKETPYLRLHIGGKGCDGFLYSIFFDDLSEKDILLSPLSLETCSYSGLIMDPFSSFYIQEATLDYLWDSEQQEEGFYLLNHHQERYQGKFWKDHPEKIPQHLMSNDSMIR